MFKKLLPFIALLMSVLIARALIAKDQDWGSYDRLLVTQRFLSAVYPELVNVRGLLILCAQEFHAAVKDIGAQSEIDLLPCHPGSGIYGGSVPGQPPPSPLPHCTGLYPSGPSEFLSVSVMFSSTYPIRSFSVSGSFLGSKGKPVQQEIIEHPEWNEEQRIGALRHASPRFGPDNKAELLRTLPVAPILRFTGCRLQLDTAILYAIREESQPDPPIARFAWRISGTRLGTEHKDHCMARFDPFEGKLVGVE
jgi:hypothetical protein